MKLHSAVFSTMAVVVIAIVATPTLYADADQAILLMRRAEPAVVKAGEPVTIYGQALDRSKVSDVMLAASGFVSQRIWNRAVITRRSCPQ